MNNNTDNNFQLARGNDEVGTWSRGDTTDRGARMFPKILVIEDSPEYQLMVKNSLGRNLAVTVCPNLTEARKAMRAGDIDLIILDVMLPDGSGFDFCSELQADEKTAKIPVIFLTGKAAVTDKVLGLTLGAEDYLTKPFEAAELKARVDSKLKKAMTAKQDESVIVRGALRLELPTYGAFLTTATAGERKLDLTPIEYKLLYRLAKNPGHILSRQQLIDSVWGPSAFIEDRSVDKHISSLRKKLGDYAFSIRTVSGLGYQFATENYS